MCLSQWGSRRGSETTSQTASGGASTTTSNSTLVTRGSPSPRSTRATTRRPPGRIPTRAASEGSTPASSAMRVTEPTPEVSAGHHRDLAVSPNHGAHHRPGAPPRRGKVDLQRDGRSARRRGEGERLRQRHGVGPPAVVRPSHREHDRSLVGRERERAVPARTEAVADRARADRPTATSPAFEARKRSTPSMVSPHSPHALVSRPDSTIAERSSRISANTRPGGVHASGTWCASTA